MSLTLAWLGAYSPDACSTALKLEEKFQACTMGECLVGGLVPHVSTVLQQAQCRHRAMVTVGTAVASRPRQIAAGAANAPYSSVEGLMGTLLRYPYEVRDEKEYFDEVQDVKVTKDMLDLAKHIESKGIDFRAGEV